MDTDNTYYNSELSVDIVYPKVVSSIMKGFWSNSIGLLGLYYIQYINRLWSCYSTKEETMSIYFE